MIKFEMKILKKPEPEQVQSKSAVILFSFMVILMIANVQLLLHYYKDWTFVEGVYCWFITFTTIGFGDYVATHINDLPDSIKVLSKNNTATHFNKDGSVDAVETTVNFVIGVLAALFYVLGLCIVSGVINSIMAAMEERKYHSSCAKCVPGPRGRRQEQIDTPELDTDTTHLGMDNVTSRKGNTGSLSVLDIK